MGTKTFILITFYSSFTSFIKPICIWSGPDDEELIVGDNAIVLHFNYGDSALSQVPLISGVNVVSESTCLRSNSLFLSITSPRTLCAGNRDGTGPAYGDSGAGLMVKRFGRWILRGVLYGGLTGNGVINLQEYLVYSDVAKYFPWIKSYIAKSA